LGNLASNSSRAGTELPKRFDCTTYTRQGYLKGLHTILFITPERDQSLPIIIKNLKSIALFTSPESPKWPEHPKAA